MSRIVSKEGNVVAVDFGLAGDALISKKQLAAHPAIGRSTRWVEMRVAEGMPSHLLSGKRRFKLAEVLLWLKANGRAAK